MINKQEMKSIFWISVITGLFVLLLVKDIKQAFYLFIIILMLIPLLTIISKKIGLHGSIIWPKKWDSKRFWNTKSIVIFTPRQFGFGWSINFAVFLNPRASLLRRGISIILDLFFAYILLFLVAIILAAINNQPIPEDFWFLFRRLN